MMVIMINVSRNAGVNYMKPRLTVMMMCCYTMCFYELETLHFSQRVSQGDFLGRGYFCFWGQKMNTNWIHPLPQLKFNDQSKACRLWCFSFPNPSTEELEHRKEEVFA